MSSNQFSLNQLILAGILGLGAGLVLSKLRVKLIVFINIYSNKSTIVRLFISKMSNYKTNAQVKV
jgi:hypothetical protein